MRTWLSVLIVLLAGLVAAQKITPYFGPFPEPAPNKNRLFYLQRSIDRNTVIYELNVQPGGAPDVAKPVKAYWIDFENGARTSPLTFIQNKLAYGVQSRLLDDNRRVYELCLVSYKKIKLYLLPSKGNHYEVVATVKGKEVVLKRIFVAITGGTYFKPEISYIELSGVDPQSGKLLSEQIKPVRD